MAENDSTSGEITAAFVNVSDIFTQYTEIPSNGFNVLYKAQRYGKWFVLKGLKPEYRNSAVHLQLLAKEFELGIQMAHPNIVHYYSKESDPVVGDCIVMEYVDGETLTAFLRKKTLPKQQRVKIAHQLLAAMAYFQGLQIVHRDLKPDNILISRNGNNVKIIDFGLGDSDTSAILKQPAGSPKYMAPEQVKGNVKIDARADLYSYAQILKQLRIGSWGWRRVQHLCGMEARDQRPTDATAVIAILSKQHRWHWTLATLLSLLVIAGIFTIIYKNASFSEYQQGTIDRGELVVVHDTIVMVDTSQQRGAQKTDTVWKELPPAVVTPEIKAFMQKAINSFWQEMADVVAHNQSRIDELAAGVAGDLQQDQQLYDNLLKTYSKKCSGSIAFLKDLRQQLKNKFPDSNRIPSYDIDCTFNDFNSIYVQKYNEKLTKLHLDIGKVDVK